MLTKVRFNNFKSFIEETIIDLKSSKLEILNDTNVYDGVLKGCCFYGANASGKTNALSAILVLPDMLVGTGINVNALFTLFNKEKIMYFEYTFQFDKDEIVYYFEIDRKGVIVKETLKLNEEEVLTRIGESANTILTETGNFNFTKVDKHILFLRVINFNYGFPNYSAIEKMFKYVSDSIYINPINDFFKVVGFNNENRQMSLYTYLDKNGDKEINNFFEEYNFPYRIQYEKPQAGNDIILSNDRKLSFIRGNMSPIPFALESNGNVILMNMLPYFLTVVKNNSFIAIDEFSSGLHNKLEELLIKYVNTHSTSCQIFFVSHSTNLLKTSLLRPDQIYSVDFNEKGSFIKKFSDEHPRESQNLEKMYLSGVFGGIPLYNEPKNK